MIGRISRSLVDDWADFEEFERHYLVGHGEGAVGWIWVPNSPVKLTRLIWYTMGTARLSNDYRSRSEVL